MWLLMLFVVVPVMFVVYCWVMFKVNHPPQQTTKEPVRFSQDALDAVQVLRSTGVSAREAKVMVINIISSDPAADAVTIARRAFERHTRKV